jgi:predicted ester cyclase
VIQPAIRSELVHDITRFWEDDMPGANAVTVRRFYEEMCNQRKNEIAPELFTMDHQMHDPQVPTAPGPQGVADAVRVYQEGVDGHWNIEEIVSTGDRVVVRWTGSGTHVGEVNGIAPTGRKVRVAAISIHRMRDGKIAETWQVWDTFGFLQQLGVVAE